MPAEGVILSAPVANPTCEPLSSQQLVFLEKREPSDSHHRSCPVERFPCELIILIFHFAAASSTEICLSLSLVSRWARDIAFKHILATIVVSNDQKILRFMDSMDLAHLHPYPPKLSRPDKSFIRNLFVPDERQITRRDDLIPSIVAACPNIANLCLTPEDALSIVLATDPSANCTYAVSLQVPRAKLKLTIFNFRYMSDHVVTLLLGRAPHRSPVYALMRELRFVENMPQVQPSLSNAHLQFSHLKRCFTLFPRLTHFATPCVPDRDMDAFGSAMALCPTDLQFFVLVLHNEGPPTPNGAFGQWLKGIRRTAKRVYFVTWTRGSLQQEWTKEALGGESLWERAVKETEQWEALPTNAI